MQYSRQAIVEMLRRAGFPDVADQAATELPDPVDVDVAADWGFRRGISRDLLISQMGGSP